MFSSGIALPSTSEVESNVDLIFSAFYAKSSRRELKIVFNLLIISNLPSLHLAFFSRLKWTFFSPKLVISINSHLVEFEHSELDLLLLMLGLLGGGVVLLLALLCATTEPQHQMEGRLLLDVVVGQGAAIFQLLAGEDQTLLIGRDTWGDKEGFVAGINKEHSTEKQ